MNITPFFSFNNYRPLDHEHSENRAIPINKSSNQADLDKRYDLDTHHLNPEEEQSYINYITLPTSIPSFLPQLRRINEDYYNSLRYEIIGHIRGGHYPGPDSSYAHERRMDAVGLSEIIRSDLLALDKECHRLTCYNVYPRPDDDDDDFPPAVVDFEKTSYVGPAPSKKLCIRTLIDNRLPKIKGNIEELESIISQELYRCKVNERLLAVMTKRYDSVYTLENTCKEAIKALNALQKSTEQALPIAHPASHSVLAQMAQKLDALSSVISDLIQSFKHRVKGILYYLPVQLTDAKIHDKSEETAEKRFRAHNEVMLLRLGNNQTGIPTLAHQHAFKNLASSSTKFGMWDSYLEADITVGETLVRTILSSGPNFGAVEYTEIAGEQKYHYVIPSNLTTVRSIARYIDAQAIANALDRDDTAPPPVSVSKNPDGSYIISDPNRNIYNFLFSAPTSYANFLYQTEEDILGKYLGTNAFCMVITDYSHMFPGGCNRMEFETAIDKNGKNILSIRFSNQDRASALKPDHSKVLNAIDQHDDKLQQRFTSSFQEYSIPLNLSNMSAAQINSHIDKIITACDEQINLIMEDIRQLSELDNWKHPAFQ